MTRPTSIRRTGVFLCALGACSTDASSKPSSVTVANGVTTVTYVAVPEVSRIHLDAAPVLDLGGMDSASELDPLQPFLGAVRLSDGRIVVNERTQLKFFTRDGKLARVAGRRGSGPGEFQQTREVCLLPADSLLVIDYATGALSLWTRDGDFVRSIPRPGFIPLRGCGSDGTIVVRLPAEGSGVSPDGSRTVLTRRMRLDGTVVRSFGLQPADLYAGPVMREATTVPYGDGLLVAEGARFEVTILSAEARPRLVIRVDAPPRELNDEEWRRMVEGMVPLGATNAARRQILQGAGRVQRPRTLPAYRRVHVDAAKRIWIENYEDFHSLTVFDSTGAFLGRVQLPWPRESRAELVRVGIDELIVLRRDSLSAPHLSFLRYTMR